jgi:hypothetical protein
MPALSITAPHLTISAFMRAVISSGVLARIAMPIWLALLWTSAAGMTSFMAWSSVAMMLAGVPFGSESPFQLVTS